MPINYRLILLLSCMLALPAQAESLNPLNTELEGSQTLAAAPRSPALSANVSAAQNIQLGLNAKQLITLSTPREHFSALFLAANQAQPRGLVILLPGFGETFDWPNTIGPLRRQLPDAGWHTLSLNLPTAPQSEPIYQPFIASTVAEQIIVEPPAPTLSEPSDDSHDEELHATAELETETVTEEIEAFAEETVAEDSDETALEPPPLVTLPPLSHPERIHSFIDAAVTYAQQLQAPKIILLGHHESAYWALNYASLQPEPNKLAIILVAARAQPDANFSYENLISAKTPALADLYYNANQVTVLAAKNRLNASKRADLTNYQQIALTASHPSLEQEQLLRRVKGWLNKN